MPASLLRSHDMHRHTTCHVLIAASLLLSLPQAQAELRYRIQILGLLPGDSYSWGLGRVISR
jgi:hypothetical protein